MAKRPLPYDWDYKGQSPESCSLELIAWTAAGRVGDRDILLRLNFTYVDQERCDWDDMQNNLEAVAKLMRRFANAKSS